MDFSLSEEQELLQDTVRGFVARECPPQTVRAIFDGERQLVPGLWKGLAEIGVAGLAVPEVHGGAGLELLELALVAEELGRGAVPVPFLGHALATLVLARGGSAAQQAAWLPRLASGDARATVALAEDGAHWLPPDWRLPLANSRVSGRKQLVPEAEGADLFVIGCRGGVLALVEAGAGVRATAEPTLDRGRPLASLDLNGAPAEALGDAGKRSAQRAEGERRSDGKRSAQRAEGERSDGKRSAQRAEGERRSDGKRSAQRAEGERRSDGIAAALVDAGSVLLAADAFGAAHQLVRATAAYVSSRRQFGQPVAQFQAVKHQLANMALDIDPTRGLWWYAAHAFDHAPGEAPRAAALAKAHIAERAQQVARDAVELHGGIGFTWESDVHLWFKRVMFDRLWLGAPELHRERFAALEGWS